MRLKGKVALVTGGAKRVGRVIALGLASQGCRVAITYRTSQAEASETVRQIRRKRVGGFPIQVDQRDGPAVRRAVRQVLSRFHRIDILINSASSFYPTPLGEATDADWQDLLSTNLAGPWYFAQAVAPIMRRQRSGKIVNIVDTAAFRPWTNYLPYCAAKGGLVTLTWGLARALAPHVQVNAIAPGPILFPPGISAREKEQAIRRTLLKRAGSPEDILQAVLFFLQGSDYVTGAVLPVDGGRLLA
ncbi:MAG: SDR family oxidoreductase [Candidatus Omnitrophica bacterium]|nr:SDR family oxidoreductase [Candidatus Omnitrophota bacterium]